MKETRLINKFSEKNSHLGKWRILIAVDPQEEFFQNFAQ